MNIRILISAILVFTFILIGKIYYDTYTIDVHHYQIANCRLADALAGKKIAFVSDLHAKRFGPREKEVISILQKENPDFILLGGDYISFCGPYEPVFSFLGQLKNAYAVMGNTEYTNENGSCLLCHMEKSPALKQNPNVRFLRNAHLRLESGKNRVNLMGVDDPVNKRDDIAEAMRNSDRALPAILLAHSPDVFEEAVQRGIDLVLCGHNHGGQVFLTRYIKGRVMVDPSFDYIEGFFNKGNTMMYVSRGVGNSYLPFRLGVKPEVTIFEFAGNEPVQHGSNVAYRSTDGIHAGFSFSNVVDLFNFSLPFKKPYETKHVMSQSGKLFDFEAASELQYLNWECRKWFELSDKHATSGKHSLQVTLPTGQYPGISFKDIENDWSRYRHFKMDLFNPSEFFTFHVRVDDKKSGWEYADRFDHNFKIQKGMNHISIPLDSVRANLTPRSLDLRSIKRVMFFIPGNEKKRTFHLDNIRLE